MRFSSSDRARPGRASGAILTWFAIASLLVSAGVGATVPVPCAHHGHAGHRVPEPTKDRTDAGALEHGLHGSPGHQSHGQDRPDDRDACDCAGSCTITSGAPLDRYVGVVTALLGLDSIDLLPAVREPRTNLRAWLFPLPNAPPRT